MQPLGAAGLALAGSIGGMAQMILTIREVGWNRFVEIIKNIKTLYFLIGMTIFGIILYFINQFLIQLIR
jgi:putative peptidoglycan lipid II flippase